MNYVILGLLAVILGAAGRYVWKAGKSGRKCIGCPGGCRCSEKGGPCGGCAPEE